MTTQDPVLIIGAGITGLVLGQALKQKSIPFKIYERDPSLRSRHQGWALTLHWALSYLPSLLPSNILAGIEGVQVDPEVAKNDTGNFLFLDLSTGHVKWRIPPNRRWRVRRDDLRGVLLEGIEESVEWGCKVEGVRVAEDDERVRVLFNDDTNPTATGLKESIPGRMIIGTEGARSPVRQFLCPESYTNNRLPVRFTGVTASLTREEIAPLRAMDPLLFKGSHPETGVFFWFSVLDTPTADPIAMDGREREGLYKAQLGISWPVKSSNDEVPRTNAERLANMKRRAEGFVDFLYNVIQNIPEDTEVVEVTLADWEGEQWDNLGGRVTLAGDAAHAMTMYRGEAGNHGILDVYHLASAIEKIYAGGDQKGAIDEYESEMRERGQRAVLLSRRACLEAHDWESLNEDCAILTRRQL